MERILVRKRALRCPEPSQHQQQPGDHSHSNDNTNNNHRATPLLLLLRGVRDASQPHPLLNLRHATFGPVLAARPFPCLTASPLTHSLNTTGALQVKAVSALNQTLSSLSSASDRPPRFCALRNPPSPPLPLLLILLLVVLHNYP